MLDGHPFLHGLAFAMLVGTSLLAPASPALAQDGNVAALPPSVRAEGPTVVHDSAYDGVRTEVRSIDVPFSGLSVVVLNVRNMPQFARNRTFGAHAHAKACATDAAASGPHHANPVGDVSRPIGGREVWLDVRVDALGRGTSIALFDWRIRKGDAGSVVIHAEPTNAATGAAGARILCTTVDFGA